MTTPIRDFRNLRRPISCRRWCLRGEFDEAVEQAIVMHQGWERAGRPPAGWMSPAFFAAALVHGLRGDEDEYARWMELGDVDRANDGSVQLRHLFRIPCRVAQRSARAGTSTVDRAGRKLSGYYDPYLEAVRVEIGRHRRI